MRANFDGLWKCNGCLKDFTLSHCQRTVTKLNCSQVWPRYSVCACHEQYFKRYILYMSAGGNFTGFEKSPDWIFPQMQKKHFLSRGPTPYLLVSHALAHSYAYASLITLSKSIPDIFRPISRQQVFSVHLFQSLEICFEFQCTYCCLYFMTKSGSRDRS